MFPSRNVHEYVLVPLIKCLNIVFHWLTGSCLIGELNFFQIQWGSHKIIVLAFNSTYERNFRHLSCHKKDSLWIVFRNFEEAAESLNFKLFPTQVLPVSFSGLHRSFATLHLSRGWSSLAFHEYFDFLASWSSPPH